MMDITEIEDTLRKDALLICDSEALYQLRCAQIASVRYQYVSLSREAFDSLVIMDLKDAEEFQSPLQVHKIMPPNEVPTVGSVTCRILEEYPYATPLEVFRHLFEEIDWFDRCLYLCVRFDRRLMSELFVRPFNASYYVEDGAHRCLAYAMLLAFDYVPYEPVGALVANDWSHIYPWGEK